MSWPPNMPPMHESLRQSVLSVRTKNALYYWSPNITLEDALFLPPETLRKIKGMGTRGIKELKEYGELDLFKPRSQTLQDEPLQLQYMKRATEAMERIAKMLESIDRRMYLR